MGHPDYLWREGIDGEDVLWICPSCDAECNADSVGDVCPSCGQPAEDYTPANRDK